MEHRHIIHIVVTRSPHGITTVKFYAIKSYSDLAWMEISIPLLILTINVSSVLCSMYINCGYPTVEAFKQFTTAFAAVFVICGLFMSYLQSSFLIALCHKAIMLLETHWLFYHGILPLRHCLILLLQFSCI